MILPLIEALGTHWHIELFETVRDSDNLREHIVVWLEEFESRYSRFRKASWLSRLNHTGEFQNPHPQFVDLLTRSLDYYRSTDGVFNIAIGDRLIKSGYDERYSFTAATELPNVPNLPDVLSVAKDRVILKEGSLDLGGIGKGYAIDALASHLKKTFRLSYFVINGGGDIYATSDHGKPVTITLAHPSDHTLAIGTLELINAGFAASSPFVRTWIDPETGARHNHLLTAEKLASYVVADTAMEADVMATVACLDPNTVLEKNLPVVIISEQGQVIANTLSNGTERIAHTLHTKPSLIISKPE